MIDAEYIRDTVHELYWGIDENCARTTLRILSHIFSVPIEKQTLDAAAGLHGAGGYRAQCGLVEGALMFIGIISANMGKSKDETVALCYRYAEAFEDHFGSLRCRELRPEGFSPDNPPHLCEKLTCKAIMFSASFISDNIISPNME